MAANRHPYNTRMTSQSNSGKMPVFSENHEMISVARKEESQNIKRPNRNNTKGSFSSESSRANSRMDSRVSSNNRSSARIAKSKGKQVVNSNKTVEPLNFSTIRTTYQYKDEVKSSRLYNLPEGKTFYPTWTEFQDPYKYIASITAEGSKYGIIKIIPPEGWKPNFSLDTTRFRFKTRKQKVNTMEGETRAKLNYIEQLQQFHAQQGRPFTRLPQLDKAPIDLHNLAKAVSDRGGPHEVSKNKQWAEVAREIKEGGYSQTCTSASKTIKERYLEFIDPYEKYISEAKQECKKKGRLDLKVDLSQSNDVCAKCGKSIIDVSKDEILSCNGDCEKRFHRECLGIRKDHLNSEAQWNCPMCLFLTGTDYGFEPGDGFTLRDLQKTADSFQQAYLKNHPVPPGVSMEDHIEAEFWRLAHAMDDNTEVYYGADINSTDYGSERDRNDPYSRDPWNLRNLPRLAGSLLHDITPAIPGMMLPWVYVGMAFSAFCWHVEDHYTYSINFMHLGETKTWYGIPSSNAHKFETAAKKLLPELFQHQPDLLTQLTTILNPEKLRQEGVEVCAIDQRPNQFVITFPQAYHAGFNHGLNCNEAVNFALPDWVKFGGESIKFYKEIKRHQVFSHEKLLWDIGVKNAHDYNVVKWLKEPLFEICLKELKLRADVIQNLGLPEPVHVFTDQDAEMVCDYCNGFSYLSALKFKCTKQILCLEHASYSPEICKCGEEKNCHFLQMRIRNHHLKSLMDDFNETYEVASKMIEYFQNDLEKATRLSAEKLEIIHDCVTKSGYDFELADSQQFIDKSLSWFRRLKKVCYKIAMALWPTIYCEIPLGKFDISDFFVKWERRVKSFQTSSDIPPSNQKHYCFCRRPDNFKTMIECDVCHEWYHCECIGIDEEEASSLDVWTCAMCNYGKDRVLKKIRRTVKKLDQLVQATSDFEYILHKSDHLVGIVQIIKSVVGTDEFRIRRATGLGLAISFHDGATRKGRQGGS
ncbi:8655_t:CDS:2 [Acaulospora morrowiae]|uniref:8655_t:CDS:1 n=1 Tax=Acaulospora morrowiae TaxID=94023 RepID=A0A9N8VV83_9GLOM|nr:8655_t:CDS:2 [Acaulospora morrowiae]